jgi:hypothetical protein
MAETITIILACVALYLILKPLENRINLLAAEVEKLKRDRKGGGEYGIR